MERARSEGATPVGSPRKWTMEEGEEVGIEVPPPAPLAPLPGGVVRKREVLSSDEDGDVGGEEVAARPRQRSLKRNKKIGFTNNLTSEQLVREVWSLLGASLVGVVLQESLNLKPGANKVMFSITTKFQVWPYQGWGCGHIAGLGVWP